MAKSFDGADKGPFINSELEPVGWALLGYLMERVELGGLDEGEHKEIPDKELRQIAYLFVELFFRNKEGEMTEGVEDLVASIFNEFLIERGGLEKEPYEIIQRVEFEVEHTFVRQYGEATELYSDFVWESGVDPGQAFNLEDVDVEQFVNTLRTIGVARKLGVLFDKMAEEIEKRCPGKQHIQRERREDRAIYLRNILDIENGLLKSVKNVLKEDF